MNRQLFDSKTDPIPQLRRDLQIIPIEQNGNSYLYFQDQRGYAPPDFAINRQVGTLLSLIDGRKSISDLDPYLGENVNPDQLLQFIRFLDENRLLASKHLESHAQKIEEAYEQSTLHESVTAGSSYPKEPEELNEYLRAAFENHSNTRTAQNIKALYAPHIDPRVALDSYVKAFAPIRNLRPKRIVILATSHYAGLYPDHYQNTPFILVNKDFDLPLGTIRRDQKTIEMLAEQDGIGISTHDRAHRVEHSIELHLLFLSYLWDHDFSIVPILVRGLDDLYHMEDGHLGQQVKNFSTILHKQFGDDDETFFLISGDLAHFGKKFGDENPASTMFEDVRSFD
ncbi:MAG TPA: AmmeMemoRadiSam system protein B, partial [Balneolaceae bacterium]|nr:AmmeMemoRadiSam system protein B [Balneolaceae bacterium]